jgi:hypothetical protein
MPPSPPTSDLADLPTLPGAAVAMPPGPNAPTPTGVPPTAGRVRWLWGMVSLLVVISLLIREASVMFPSVAVNVKPCNLTWIEGSAVLPSDLAQCPDTNLSLPANYLYPHVLRRDGGIEGIIAWAGRFAVDLEKTDAANAANEARNCIIAPRLFELQGRGNRLLTLTRKGRDVFVSATHYIKVIVNIILT